MKMNQKVFQLTVSYIFLFLHFIETNFFQIPFETTNLKINLEWFIFGRNLPKTLLFSLSVPLCFLLFAFRILWHAALNFETSNSLQSSKNLNIGWFASGGPRLVDRNQDGSEEGYFDADRHHHHQTSSKCCVDDLFFYRDCSIVNPFSLYRLSTTVNWPSVASQLPDPIYTYRLDTRLDNPNPIICPKILCLCIFSD